MRWSSFLNNEPWLALLLAQHLEEKLLPLVRLLITTVFLLACPVTIAGPQLVPPAFDAAQAYQFIEQQVSFGPRVPNTEAHRLCGAYLQEQLTAMGAQVCVQRFQAKTFDGQLLDLQNIIASFNPDCQRRVLLAAHWDTRPWADKDPAKPHALMDGANDGASGVGVLLALAQALGQQPPAGVGVDMIFFDGEDYGPPHGTAHAGSSAGSWCLGAQHWARHPHVPGYQAEYGVLLDMVGARDATFYREHHSMHYAAGVVKKIWQVARQLGHGRYFLPQRSQGHMLDDHVWVNQVARIPMVNIVDHGPGKHMIFKAYHHTRQDNMRLIDQQTLQAVGETLLHVIYTEP